MLSGDVLKPDEPPAGLREPGLRIIERVAIRATGKEHVRRRQNGAQLWIGVGGIHPVIDEQQGGTFVHALANAAQQERLIFFGINR